MKILVIAPHMDDETLGLGGTIRKHVNNGDNVYVAIIANRIYDHQYDENLYHKEKESVFKAKKILDYLDVTFFDLHDERLDICLQDIIIPLENYYNRILPDVVYVNYWEDNNQDHRAVFNASRVVLRRASSKPPKKIIVYETPSSTEQTLPAFSIFTPNYYVNISNFIQIKLAAIACYETEARIYPHPRSSEAILNLSKRRGIESGFKNAEAFMVIYDQWS